MVVARSHEMSTLQIGQTGEPGERHLALMNLRIQTRFSAKRGRLRVVPHELVGWYTLRVMLQQGKLVRVLISKEMYIE